MENYSQNEIDYSIAKERVQRMKKFYTNLGIFILVFLVYSFYQYYYHDEITFLKFDDFFGVFWIWGIILAIKAVKVFFLNAGWERKMMDRELNRTHNGNL